MALRGLCEKKLSLWQEKLPLSRERFGGSKVEFVPVFRSFLRLLETSFQYIVLTFSIFDDLYGLSAPKIPVCVKC